LADQKIPVSVCLIAGAEAARIGRTLASVAAWASEIIVVLNADVTDGTDKIAESFGAKVFREPWKGFIAQKNSAAEKCTQPWLLNLDADEEVPAALAGEIRHALSAPDGHAAFNFPRCTIFCGRWIRHGDWYPDRVTRLWRRETARWTGEDPHAKLTVTGTIGRLRSDLLHNTAETIDRQIAKIATYTETFARDARTQGRRAHLLELLLRPVWRFFRSYFLRLGFLDGWQGYYIAWMTSFYTATRYAKLQSQSGEPPLATTLSARRVLHINSEKTWRGGERQTLLTVMAQRAAGMDSHLALRRGSPLAAKAQEAGVPFIALPNAAPAMLAKLIWISSGFDLLHCHTGRAHSLCALAGLLGRKPLVVSRRVDFPPRNNWFNRFKYRRANRVVCVSGHIATQMRAANLSADRLTVIHDAVPAENFPTKEICRAQLAAHLALPPGRRLVGNIAALVPHKDHATLLRAAQRVLAQRRDVAFVVIGEGELREELLQLRAELGLEKDFHFAGFIPQAQQLLPAFDVFAMSSNMEGLGSIVLDAGLANVPVAATAGGGLPEIVAHEQTGLLVPVGDAEKLAAAILRLLNDGALGARLTAAAAARVRADFSVTTMAAKYQTVYTEIYAAGANCLLTSPSVSANHADKI
jgi:glycosyltransferase involved in cell wall biosynthesis